MNARYPSLTVDCVVFDPDGRLLLIAGKSTIRGSARAARRLCRIRRDDRPRSSRELAEETGLVAVSASLVGVYSDPHRDPRGQRGQYRLSDRDNRP